MRNALYGTRVVPGAGAATAASARPAAAAAIPSRATVDGSQQRGPILPSSVAAAVAEPASGSAPPSLLTSPREGEDGEEKRGGKARK